MLNTYHRQVTRLLHEERQQIVNPKDLTDYINIARGQVAGESECIRVEGSFNTVVGQRQYFFNIINLGAPGATGVEGVINVRSLQYFIAGGRRMAWPRPWPWYEQFCLNNANPQNGSPITWSQYGQGAGNTSQGGGTGPIDTAPVASAGGSIWIDPPPDLPYLIAVDCTCYPTALTSDTTPEALSYLWTDAVPFLAAWYALIAMQASPEREQAMMQRYNTFMGRARQFANPSVNRWIYEQSTDPVQASKLNTR